MAVTYKGMPHRKRVLAPEVKFKAKRGAQWSFMIPMQKISKPVLESIELQEPNDSKPATDDVKPIVAEDEPIVKKPKKRGRPKRVKEELGEKDVVSESNLGESPSV